MLAALSVPLRSLPEPITAELPADVRAAIECRMTLASKQPGLARQHLDSVPADSNGTLVLILEAEACLAEGRKREAAQAIATHPVSEWHSHPLAMLTAFRLLWLCGQESLVRRFWLQTRLEAHTPWTASAAPGLWETRYRLVLSGLRKHEQRMDRARHEARAALDLVRADIVLAVDFVERVPDDLDDVVIDDWEKSIFPERAAALLESSSPSASAASMPDLCLAYRIAALQASAEQRALWWDRLFVDAEWDDIECAGIGAAARLCDPPYGTDTAVATRAASLASVLLQSGRLSTRAECALTRRQATAAFENGEYGLAWDLLDGIADRMGASPEFLAAVAATAERTQRLEIASETWRRLFNGCDVPWLYAAEHPSEIEALAARPPFDPAAAVLVATARAARERLDDGLQLLTAEYRRGSRDLAVMEHLLNMLAPARGTPDTDLQRQVAADYLRQNGQDDDALAIALAFLSRGVSGDDELEHAVSSLARHRPHVVAAAAVRVHSGGDAHVALDLVLNTGTWKRVDAPDAMMCCEQILLAASHHDLALRCCDRALELEPDHEWFLAEMAKICQMLGKADEAVQRYRDALAIVPDYRFTVIQLVNLLAGSQRGQEAAALLLDTMRRSLQPAYGHTLLKLMAATEPQRLRENVETVVELFPAIELEKEFRRFDPRIESPGNDSAATSGTEAGTKPHATTAVVDRAAMFVHELQAELEQGSLHSCAVVPSTFPRGLSGDEDDDNENDLTPQQKRLRSSPRVLVIMRTLHDDLEAKLRSRGAAVRTAVARSGIGNMAEVQCIHPAMLWNAFLLQEQSTREALQHAEPVYDESRFLEAIRLALEHRDLVLNRLEQYVVSYSIAGSVVNELAQTTSDVDVWVVIDDTDVRKLTREELKNRLRTIIVSMIPDAKRVVCGHEGTSVPVNVQTMPIRVLPKRHAGKPGAVRHGTIGELRGGASGTTLPRDSLRRGGCTGGTGCRGDAR